MPDPSGKESVLTDFNSVAFIITQELCEWFHCEWGIFWHIDSSGSALSPVANWRAPSLSLERLFADTKDKRLKLGEGNAGLVWRTGKPICADNLTLQMCLPRSLDANAAGLRGGIWIPVPAKKMMLGVIELLGRHYWANNEAFLYELKQIGLEVGQASEPINKS